MYEYQELPPIAELGRTPPFSRILYLHPGVGEEEPLSGHLEVVNIECAGQYEALSYTWGTGSPSNYIWLSGEPLSIQPHLEAALHRLRLPDSPRRLWVDALCIDQSNVDERSRQVQYMRLVYKHCNRVLVWLGPRTQHTESAFEAARRFATVTNLVEESSQQNRDSNGTGLDQEIISEMLANVRASLPEDSMQHLQELFDRAYFTRSWVVQEVAAGAPSLAMCGDLEIPFFDLLSILFIWGHNRKESTLAHSLDIWYFIFTRNNPNSPVRMTDVHGSLGPMMTLLDSMRSFQATDPRDKIYCTLGICDEGLQPILSRTHITRNTDQRLSLFHRAITGVQNAVNNLKPGLDIGIPEALKPDYRKDIVAVYTDTARYFIGKSPMLLDVLGCVQHHGDPSVGDFPSWVPKWFESRRYQSFIGVSFTAGICTPPASDFFQSRVQRALAHPRHLVLDGFHLGTVQQVTNAMTFGRSPTERTAAILQIWSQLFPFPMSPPPTQIYLTGERLDEAFCKALTAHPVGIMYGSMFSEEAMVFATKTPQHTRQSLEHLSERCVGSFLGGLSNPDIERHPERAWESKSFRNAFATYSWNRKAFITSEGHIGIGPAIMQPGDEVVVLFRGRMPFILRRRPDHHVLIGDCYVRDNEIMFGTVTESVRHGRGGPPARLYELR